MGCQASRPQVEEEGEASAFCAAAGLPQYAETFARAGYDDRATLAALTDNDLETVSCSVLFSFYSLFRWYFSFRFFHFRYPSFRGSGFVCARVDRLRCVVTCWLDAQH